MRETIQAAGVNNKEAPIDSPGTRGIVERFPDPLFQAFYRIRQDMDQTKTDYDCLRMAIFAENRTVGREGLCPIIMVFGAIPMPEPSIPALSQLRRTKVIESSMHVVQRKLCAC